MNSCTINIQCSYTSCSKKWYFLLSGASKYKLKVFVKKDVKILTKWELPTLAPAVINICYDQYCYFAPAYCLLQQQNQCFLQSEYHVGTYIFFDVYNFKETKFCWNVCLFWLIISNTFSSFNLETLLPFITSCFSSVKG